MPRKPEDVELTFENYLAGKPVNDEIAALREGRTLEPVPEVTTPFTPTSGNISRRDRVDLKELVAMPGYPVLHRVIENATLRALKRATVLSEDDPLAKSQEIAQAWAYVKIRRDVQANLLSDVTEELKKLEEEPDEAQPAKQGTQAKRTSRRGSGSRARANKDNG